jgi:hypothetical protein
MMKDDPSLPMGYSFLNPITKTQPYLLHCNGHWGGPEQARRHPLGDAVWQRQKGFLASSGAARPLADLSLVCFSNYPFETLFEQSARAWGYPLKVVGRSVARFNFRKKYEALLEEALPGIATPWVLMADSRDVFIVRPLEGLVAEAGACYPGADMVYNAERFRWPDKAEAGLFAFEEERYGSVSPWRYLNSGLGLLRTESLRPALEELLRIRCAPHPSNSAWRRLRYRLFHRIDVDFDDQEALHHYHSRHHPKIVADARCALFQTTGRINLDWSLGGA